MKITHKDQIRRSESGFAAILVTMVIMIVISLIVLGFAQIARREQRQSLDRQLSTQAFYAAESGINDAVTFVRNTPVGTTSKTTCATPTPTGTEAPYDTMPATSVLNAVSGVAYTCLLIDPAPTTQQYRDVGGSSVVIPIKSATGTPIRRITFMWQPAAGQAAGTAGCPALVTLRLPQLDQWNVAGNPCTFGLARMDLVSTDGTFDRTQLSQQAMSGFFVPNASGPGSTNFKPNSTGSPINALYAASCGAICSQSVTNLNGVEYQMRIRFIYQPTALLEIRAYDIGGSVLRITGNQIIVDATGKANDVLRRLQVRVPVFQSAVVPDYAIQTTNSICKQFAIAPGVDTGQGPGVPSAGADAKATLDMSDPDPITSQPDCKTYGF